MAIRTKIIISAGDQTARGFNSVKKRIDSIDDGLAGVTQSVRTFFGIAGAGVAFTGLIKAGDAVKSIDSQLRLVTKSQEQFAIADQFVLKTSIETGTTLKNNADLYANLSRSSNALKEDQSRLAGVQTTINKALAIGNRSTAENDAVIRQLTQGLSAGVLRGEEFNSVMENSPRLALVLADALGKTKGELRAMAEEGELTADIVIAALENQSAVIEREFDGISLTASRAWTAATEAATDYVGSTDSVTNVNTLIATGLQGIAENFETVAKYGEAAAVVMVSRYAGKGITAIQDKVTATYADIKSEQAKQAATTRTMAVEAQAASVAVNRARTELTLAQSFARTAQGAAQSQLAETRLLAARRGLTAATQQAGVANAAYSASLTRSMGVAKALRGVMALMGGPAGVVTLGAIALGSWALSASSAAEKTESLNAALDRYASASKTLRAQQIQDDISGFRAELKKVNAEMAPFIEQGREAGVAYGALDKKALRLEESISVASKQLKEMGTQAGSISPPLATLGNDVDNLAESLKSTYLLTSKEKALEKLRADLLSVADAMDDYRESSGELGVSLEDGAKITKNIEKEIAKLTKTQKKAEKATKDVASGFNEADKAMEGYITGLVSAQDEAEMTQRKFTVLFRLFKERALGKTEAENLKIYNQAVLDLYPSIEKLTDKTKDAGDETTAYGETIRDDLSTSMADSIVAGDDFGDSMEALWKRMAADWAKAGLTKLFGSLLSGGGADYSGFSIGGGSGGGGGSNVVGTAANVGVSAGAKAVYAKGAAYFAKGAATETTATTYAMAEMAPAAQEAAIAVEALGAETAIATQASAEGAIALESFGGAGEAVATSSTGAGTAMYAMGAAAGVALVAMAVMAKGAARSAEVTSEVTAKMAEADITVSNAAITFGRWGDEGVAQMSAVAEQTGVFQHALKALDVEFSAVGTGAIHITEGLVNAELAATAFTGKTNAQLAEMVVEQRKLEMGLRDYGLTTSEVMRDVGIAFGTTIEFINSADFSGYSNAIATATASSVESFNTLSADGLATKDEIISVFGELSGGIIAEMGEASSVSVIELGQILEKTGLVADGTLSRFGVVGDGIGLAYEDGANQANAAIDSITKEVDTTVDTYHNIYTSSYKGDGGGGDGGFADGGISYGAQRVWVSEGRYPVEAHVPLPNGRSIPVEVRGNVGGSNNLAMERLMNEFLIESRRRNSLSEQQAAELRKGIDRLEARTRGVETAVEALAEGVS